MKKKSEVCFYKKFYISLIFFIFSFLNFFSCSSVSMSEKIDQNLVSKAKSEFPEYDSQLAYKVPQEFLSDEEIYKLILDAAISLYKQAVSNSDFELLKKAGEYFYYIYSRTGSSIAKDYLLKIREFKANKLKEYINLAKNYEKKKDIITAAVLWGKILQIEPNNQEAKDFFSKNKTIIDKEIENYLKNAEIYIANGKFSSAEKLLNTVLLFDKNNVKANELLKKINEEKQKLATQNFNKGVELFNKKDYDNAAKYFKIALEYGYDKNKINSYLDRINSIILSEKLYQNCLEAYNKGDFFNAAKIAQDLMKLDPNYKDIKDLYQKIKNQIIKKIEELYQKGIDLFNKKLYKEALEIFSQIALYDPNYKDISEYIEACKAKIQALTGED